MRDIQVRKPRDGFKRLSERLLLTELSGPEILVTLQQQLGLKLVLGKGRVEFIVIDHVERPSAN